MFRERPIGRGKRPDYVLLITTLILVSFGTVMIYSSSSIIATMGKSGDGYFYLKKQLFFFVVGLAAMLALCRIPYEYFKRFAYPGVAVSLVLLLVLFIPRLGVKVGGATRWLNLGFFTFQVTELVKIALILFLAHFLTKNNAQIRELRTGLLMPLTVTAVFLGLIMLQPDFGTAGIVAVVLVCMLFLAGSRIMHLSAMVGVLVPVAVWLVMHKRYRMERIFGFFDPWKDAQKSGFQIIQSFISFGSGGTFGVGLGDGMQKLFYLPEPHTDFILSVIAEESGFIGVAAVIILFLVFVFRGFIIAFKAPDLFGTLLAAGLTTLIATEALINIAVVMALVPTKGLVLPFLSYGGSSLIMSMAAVGMLLSISTARK
ncbi:MAG: putative lipid II flippase FtsW [Syntrophales bacterium]